MLVCYPLPMAVHVTKQKPKSKEKKKQSLIFVFIILTFFLQFHEKKKSVYQIRFILFPLTRLFLVTPGIPCPIIVAWAIGKLYYENEQ